MINAIIGFGLVALVYWCGWSVVYWVLGIFLEKRISNSFRGFIAAIMLYFIVTYPIWHEVDREIYWGIFATYVFCIVLVGGHHLSKLDD